jgi:hypothetical protein
MDKYLSVNFTAGTEIREIGTSSCFFRVAGNWRIVADPAAARLPFPVVDVLQSLLL